MKSKCKHKNKGSNNGHSRGNEMKTDNRGGTKSLTDRDFNREVTKRLDESLPLQTEDWIKVEQVLMRLSEFAPESVLLDLATAIAFYADDQARRGYVLGQEDLIARLRAKTAA